MQPLDDSYWVSTAAACRVADGEEVWLEPTDEIRPSIYKIIET
jgi:hypothetical protein